RATSVRSLESRWARARSSTSAKALEMPYGREFSRTSSTWRAVRPYGSRFIATAICFQVAMSPPSSAERMAEVGQNSTGRSTLRGRTGGRCGAGPWRSEEHTSELQSHLNLVCRLLLEKKDN